jgi:TolB-like protein
MEDTEVPLEHLHEHARERAEHSGETWISWVALSTAVLAVLAAIAGLLSGKHANEAMMRQIEASDRWNYYQAKSIKAAVLDAKMSLQGTNAQSTHPVVSQLPQKSIAVLPFTDFTDKRGNVRFAQTIQDQILTNLAQAPDVKVISREWVMRYKPGVDRNSGEIGRQLGVRYLLQGSVQSAGNRVRLNAQLIDAETSYDVWAEHYDGDLTELNGIENDLVESVLSQLNSTFSSAEKIAAELPATTDPVGSDQEKASKYRDEEVEIKSDAEHKELEAKTNFHKHEVFAHGVTMFQIGIAIAAISALTQKRRFWTVSLIFGLIGCVFLVFGFFAG